MAVRPGSPDGDRLSLATKLSYGLGEAAEGVKSAALETFLFFYYVQVVGLSGSLAGVALMIALLFDGIVDPAIGNLSDNLRTPLGRRHPLLYASALPLVAAMVMLFRPPAGMTQAATFAWLLGFTMLSRLMQSLYFVPHMALGAELSADFDERVSVSTYRTLFSFLGRMASLWVAFTLFFTSTPTHPNGQLNPAAYPPFALVVGSVAAGVILLSAAGTQRRAIRTYRAASGTSLSARSGGLPYNLRTAFRVRSFALYFTAVLVSYILGGVQAALSIHLNTFYWRLSPDAIQFVLIANTVGFMTGALFARRLSNRFDKKPTYIACVVVSVLLIALPIVLEQAGLYPAGGVALTRCLAANGFVAGVTGGPAFVVAAAMLADVADDYELRFGTRCEGFLFGANAFTRKASLGVGGALAGVMLDLIGFPHGGGAAVPREAAVRLAWIFGPGMLVFSLGAMVILSFYDISRARHAEILAGLAARRRPALPAEPDFEPMTVGG